jgi:luciferase family oxidoreductase group 1
MTRITPILFSILDLAPVTTGSTAAVAFRNSLDLAQHAERWGYHRFWLAEHHNIPAVASAATSILIAHVAAGTSRIRVGSGGIMLPNHAPLVIAEQFGTLESLHPGRIDLGVGRAPGGDTRTARALRRYLNSNADTFPDDLMELMNYLHAPEQIEGVRAIPGAGLKIPIYLLGSSDFSARLGAMLGLPFAFASHFAPDYLHLALELYRSTFQPSASLPKPHVIVGLNLIAADTDHEARRLFTTLQQQFLNLIRRKPSEVPPPVDSMDGLWSPPERAHVERMTCFSLVGSAQTVRAGLQQIIADTGADEIIATGSIYDHAARLRSFEIGAEVFKSINAGRETARRESTAA